MNGTFGSSAALASVRDKQATAVFDASAFVLAPAKSGAENRAASQAMVDAACAAGGGTITVPANGAHEIAGEVVVTSPPCGTITISGSGGQSKLVQTNDASSIFILGSEDETAVSGDIAMRDLWIEGSFSPGPGSEQRRGQVRIRAWHDREACSAEFGSGGS